MSVHQAIIVLEDLSFKEVIQAGVRAGMEILAQFDPNRSAYSGDFTRKLFEKDYAEWCETGCEQKIFSVSSTDALEEVEFHCNMEGTPTNFITGEGSDKILVIGPFDSNRLNFYTQNCKQI